MQELTKIVKHIKLEMSGDTKRYLVSVKQGDKATRCIIATLLDNGEEYIIPTGARVKANIEKPDGKHVYNACTYSGSEVTIELTNQAIAAPGTAYCDIEISTSDDSQIVSSASFTMEIEKSRRNDKAIMSSNEFSELEKRVIEHITRIDETNEIVKKAEEVRASEENVRVEAEKERETGEEIRKQNEEIRIQNEKQREIETSQAVEKANNATKECKQITEQAENALQNQEQLEETMNTANQIRQEVSQMKSQVDETQKQVEQDKQQIDEIIQNSLIENVGKLLETAQNYFERAEALYSSMYLDCDGETPYLRTVTPIFIDGATPQVRNANEGVEFDGGTPTYRQLAA